MVRYQPPDTGEVPAVNDPGRIWLVTITLCGETQREEVVRVALERLQQERPFLHSVRYDNESAELQYWEQAEHMLDAASLAMRVWNEHRESCRLPPWELVGLEVVERELSQRRSHATSPAMLGMPGAKPRPLL
jgi:hypothetical protein